VTLLFFNSRCFLTGLKDESPPSADFAVALGVTHLSFGNSGVSKRSVNALVSIHEFKQGSVTSLLSQKG